MKLLHRNEIQNFVMKMTRAASINWISCKRQRLRIFQVKWMATNGIIIVMERNIECSTFFAQCWPAKMSEKKNSARLNEQLFNANGDRGEFESAGKNSRVFSQRCGTTSYEEAGTSRSNFYMSTISNYLPTSIVLLRFYWLSMRMHSKIECWPIILEEKIKVSILSPFLFKNSNDFFLNIITSY